MIHLDYTFERQIILEREDARREGYEEGFKEGYEKGFKEGLVIGEAMVIKNLLLAGMNESDVKLFAECGQELIDKVKKEL